MSTRQIVIDIPEDTYTALQCTALQTRQTESQVAVAALEAFLSSATDPLVGLFANEPDLIDDIVAEAMENRQEMPLRLDDIDRG